MPRGDGTGPMGMGPMTGRAAGYCAGYSAPGFANPLMGRGRGMAWGRGGGGGLGLAWRRGGRQSFAGSVYPMPAYVAPPGREEQLDILRSQADWLKEQLDTITKQISELDQK
jgi:hypothetical protein